MKPSTKSDIMKAIWTGMFWGSIIAFIMLATQGCCISKGKVTYPDGRVTEFANYRAIWSTEAYKFDYSTNSIKLDVQKSNPDAQTLTAIKDLIIVAKP